MALSSITKNLDNVATLMSHVYIEDPASPGTFLFVGDVNSPTISAEEVLREPDSEGRQPVASYDVTISFNILLPKGVNFDAVMSGAENGVNIFLTKTVDGTATLPSYDSATGTYTGSADGYFILNLPLRPTLQMNFTGETSMVAVTANFRALPSDLAALFDGVNNMLTLP